MVETSIGTQRSSLNFVIAEDAAAVVPAEATTEARLKRQNFIDALSDSNTVVWAETTSGHVDVQSTTLEPGGGSMFVSPREGRFLAEIRRELDRLGEPVRSSLSAKLCERFAKGVGMALANQLSIRWALFADEEDSVTLLAHSRASKRQVSFEFALSESSITVVQIDEKMRRFRSACGINHMLQLANAIAWLKPVNGTNVGPFSVDMQEVEMLFPGMTRGDTLASQKRQLGIRLVPTSVEQRIANLRAWIATHSPLPYEADDSRESIYEDREE